MDVNDEYHILSHQNDSIVNKKQNINQLNENDSTSNKLNVNLFNDEDDKNIIENN